MKTAAQVLEAFDRIRRAQKAGAYAPHKPLLILLALTRVQRDEPRLVEFGALDAPMRALLSEFGPGGSAKSRHYPFWHLATDGQRALWELHGPRDLLARPPGATPNLGELRARHVQGGSPVARARHLFPPDAARRHRRRGGPGLLPTAAGRPPARTRVPGLEREERVQGAGAPDPRRYAPRSTLNSRNRRTGSGVSSFHTMLIGRSPSADSSSTGPQAR